MLNDIPIPVSVVLGTTDLSIRQILKVGRGATIPLNCSEADPSLVIVEGKTIAKGIILVRDEKMSLRVTEVTERKD